MADLDDVRGVTLAALNAVGMVATIVGVPVLVARRLARGRRPLVVPGALAVAAGLTVVTRRMGWGLVALWLGIDRAARAGRAGRTGRGAGLAQSSGRASRRIRRAA